MPRVSLAFSSPCCPPALVLLLLCSTLPSSTPEAMKRPHELQGMFVRLERSCIPSVVPLAAICPVTFLGALMLFVQLMTAHP